MWSNYLIIFFKNVFNKFINKLFFFFFKRNLMPKDRIRHIYVMHITKGMKTKGYEKAKKAKVFFGLYNTNKIFLKKRHLKHGQSINFRLWFDSISY